MCDTDTMYKDRGHRHLHACMQIDPDNNTQGAYNVGIYILYIYIYIYVQGVGHYNYRYTCSQYQSSLASHAYIPIKGLACETSINPCHSSHQS